MIDNLKSWYNFFLILDYNLNQTRNKLYWTSQLIHQKQQPLKLVVLITFYQCFISPEKTCVM